MKENLKDMLTGLLWAVLILATVFTYYTLCVDVPEFRYVGF